MRTRTKLTLGDWFRYEHRIAKDSFSWTLRHPIISGGAILLPTVIYLVSLPAYGYLTTWNAATAELGPTLLALGVGAVLWLMMLAVGMAREAARRDKEQLASLAAITTHEEPFSVTATPLVTMWSPEVPAIETPVALHIGYMRSGVAKRCVVREVTFEPDLLTRLTCNLTYMKWLGGEPDSRHIDIVNGDGDHQVDVGSLCVRDNTIWLKMRRHGAEHPIAFQRSSPNFDFRMDFYLAISSVEPPLVTTVRLSIVAVLARGLAVAESIITIPTDPPPNDWRRITQDGDIRPMMSVR